MEVSHVEYIKALYEIGKQRHKRLDAELDEQKEEFTEQIQTTRDNVIPLRIEEEGKGQNLSIAA